MILKNIVSLCNKQGISLSKLERDVGLSNATIRRWEKASPTVENLQKVANYFGVSIESLISAPKEE